MAASIKDLLKYKTKVDLVDKNEKVQATAWVRLLGEEDTTQASKLARIASTRMRATLRDVESVDYKDRIEPIADLERGVLEAMVISARQNRFTADAFVKVDREELPKIEEVAEEPDAPSLEEQELLDKAIADQQEDYEKRIDAFVNSRIEEAKLELAAITNEELIVQAQTAMSDILPLQAFFEEFNAQKLFRGTYNDKLCKERTFDTVAEYKDAEASVKEQLLSAYQNLEIDPADLKNS